MHSMHMGCEIGVFEDSIACRLLASAALDNIDLGPFDGKVDTDSVDDCREGLGGPIEDSDKSMKDSATPFWALPRPFAWHQASAAGREEGGRAASLDRGDS